MAKKPDAFTGTGWGTVTDVGGTWPDAVTVVFDTLIPLLIAQFRHHHRDVVQQVATEASRVTLAHGESFFFHDGHPKTIVAGGNAIAVQVAAAAVLGDEGTTYRGRHWCVGGCPRCVVETRVAMGEVDRILDDLEAVNS